MLKRLRVMVVSGVVLAVAGYVASAAITAGARPTVGAHAAGNGSSMGSTSSGSGMMNADTGAKIAVLTPTPGQVITGNSVATSVLIKHFMVDCDYAGTANRMGMGHYHIHLDGALVNMFCGPKARVSLANVKPGRHTLEFIAAENNHMEDMHSAKMVSFIYRPAHKLMIAPRQFSGLPSITIVSPANGATVSSGFNLVVKIRNFVPSCALFGKPDLAGYGHWHAFVDTTMGGAMGMGTMLGMSCAHSFHVHLNGIKPGVHKFFAELEDDAHAPTIKGHSMAEVTLTVK